MSQCVETSCAFFVQPPPARAPKPGESRLPVKIPRGKADLRPQKPAGKFLLRPKKERLSAVQAVKKTITDRNDRKRARLLETMFPSATLEKLVAGPAKTELAAKTGRRGVKR